MKQPLTDQVPPNEWTLIRGARQLLTLCGFSGPRRGPGMACLNAIPDGAILLHNGLIEKVGTSRQVENFAAARKAREIDATGKIVMPSFVDPDVALAGPPPCRHPGPASDEVDIRLMSKKRLDGIATLVATDLVRYGVLTAGAHTHFAPDLRNTLKALRTHQTLQSRPLRIRSVFAPPWTAEDAPSPHFGRLRQTWMPAVSRSQLASLLEVPVGNSWVADAQALAEAAAGCSFNIRFRAAGVISEEMLRLAHSAGALAVLGAIPENNAVSRALADAGCVHVALASDILAGKFVSSRGAIDDGMPLALASGYRSGGAASLNPQFLLYLACQELGMTAEEAILAATYNAACSLRCSHVTGSLEPGKSADICVMDVDDYRELPRRAGHNDAWLVMRAGKIVYRRSNLTLE